jgi:hypothetical protein
MVFDQIPFFAISKMAKYQFLNWEKFLKLPKIQFHEFFAWTSLNFLAHCVAQVVSFSFKIRQNKFLQV